MKDLVSPPDLKAITTWLGTGSINLFGFPYAGKDTHGRELAELLGAPLLGGGEILRNSTIPPHVKELIDAGFLAPIDDYIKIVTPYLGRDEFKGKPLILSSVGRWKGEEEGVISALEASGHPLKAVIFLNITPDTVRERWRTSQSKQDRGGRVDDAEHLLDVRIDEFQNKTLPIIEHYRGMGILIEINSIMPQDEVSKEILTQLLALSK